MKPAPAVFACILLLQVAAASRGAQQPGASAAPPDDEIRRLILRLGDPEFATREAAAERIRAVGKPALPALKEAAGGADPEIRTRAAALVRRLERRPLPGGPLDRGAGRQRYIFGNGKVTIDQGVRQFEIERSDDEGIRITVTANVDGKKVTETYAARNVAELKEMEPEAFAVFERFGDVLISGIEMHGGQVVFENRLVRIRDELDVLRDTLQEQMRDNGIGAAQVKEVLSQLERLQAVRRGEVAIMPAEPDRQVKEFFRLSDGLRTKLAELKLDAGDALPPPPNQRLGVQIILNTDALTGETDGVIVQMVVTGSRAGKIGVKEGDHIRKVNDRVIRSTQDIREALAGTKGGLAVEVVREGKTIKLTEQVEEKK